MEFYLAIVHFTISFCPRFFFLCVIMCKKFCEAFCLNILKTKLKIYTMQFHDLLQILWLFKKIRENWQKKGGHPGTSDSWLLFSSYEPCGFSYLAKDKFCPYSSHVFHLTSLTICVVPPGFHFRKLSSTLASQRHNLMNFWMLHTWIATLMLPNHVRSNVRMYAFAYATGVCAFQCTLSFSGAFFFSTAEGSSQQSSNLESTVRCILGASRIQSLKLITQNFRSVPKICKYWSVHVYCFAEHSLRCGFCCSREMFWSGVENRW